MSAARPHKPAPAHAKPPAAKAPAKVAAKAAGAPAQAAVLRPPRKPLPPRPQHWLIGHALHIGIGVSIIWHGFLFAIGFVNPDAGIRKQRDNGLEVVLVNAKHAKRPKEAQALAQANLDGGGNQDQKNLMPSSPLPPQESNLDGDALIETQQRVQQLESLQRELLARSKGGDIPAPPARQVQDSERIENTPPPNPGEDRSQARAIARQEAVVSQKLQDYAAKPRKGFISPRTQESLLAQYGEAWRNRVQRFGDLNFPRSAKGALYGSVMVSVEIQPDGRLLSAEVVRPDRDKRLNEAALRIIKLAAPFAPIPPEVRKKYDVLVLTRTMNFTRDDIRVNRD